MLMSTHGESTQIQSSTSNETQMLAELLSKYTTRPIGIDNFGKPVYITCKQENDKVIIRLPYCTTQDFVRIKDKIKAIGFRYNPEQKTWVGTVSQYAKLANEIFDYLPVAEKILAYNSGTNHRILQIVKEKIAQYTDAIVTKAEKELTEDYALQIDRDIKFIKQQIPSLYEYQIKGISFILKNYYSGKRGFILNDAPGLGKTVQAIGFIMSVYHKDMTAAFFTTNAMVPIIAEEFYKFDRTHMLINRLSNVPKEKHICILPYSMLTAKNKVLKLLSIKFDIIILDESQNLKNIRSKRVKVFENIQKNARFILAMTGTLFKNRPLEAYNIMKYVRILDEKMRIMDFIRHFEGEVSAYFYRKNSPYKYYNTIQSEAVVRLRTLLEKSGQYVRRSKEDVIKELPQKQRIIVPTDLPETLDIKQIINLESEIIKKLNMRYKLTPEEAQRLSTYRRIVGLHKVPSIIEYIGENLSDRNRLIIFAHHKEVIDKIHESLSQMFTDALVMKVNGDTPSNLRDQYVAAFQGEAEKAILVLSLAVMSEGVTLTKGNEIVFAEIDWVPATMLQAEDRIHRISQKASTCFYYYMIAPNTLDQYVYNVINNKNIYIQSFENK